MIGRKLFVRCKDVKVIKVSHYKGLRIKDILSFASSRMNIEDYLPDYDYNKEPNRVRLCNIVNSLIEDEFKTYIAKKIKQRKQVLIHSQNLFMTVKPEFLNLLKKFTVCFFRKGEKSFFNKNTKDNKWPKTNWKAWRREERTISQGKRIRERNRSSSWKNSKSNGAKRKWWRKYWKTW